MVEKPDYVLNFIRLVNTEIKYIRGITCRRKGKGRFTDEELEVLELITTI